MYDFSSCVPCAEEEEGLQDLIRGSISESEDVSDILSGSSHQESESAGSGISNLSYSGSEPDPLEGLEGESEGDEDDSEEGEATPQDLDGKHHGNQA